MGRLRDLLFNVRYEWHLPSLLIIALFVLLIALFARDPLNLEQGTGQAVDARITRLSTLGNRYQGRWPGLQVSAETADGIKGTTTALPPDLNGCEVGDKIEARQSGLKLYLTPRPCS